MKFGEKQLPQYQKIPEQKNNNYKNTSVDWKLYEPDPESLLPYGKYVNRSLQWVEDNDPKYFEWMCNNNIIGNWSLLKLRSSKQQIVVEEDSTVENWVCLVEYPGTGIKSQYL